MTLKEIASMADVSMATVSYVLNGSTKVGDETRKKVENIIKETGYRSNMLAKSLRKNKSFLIGVIVEDITVWHTALIIDGINEIAESNGYHTILSNLRLLSKIESRFDHISDFQDDIDKSLDVLIGMQVDGIIYVGMHDRKVEHIIPHINKPVVYCYCYSDGEGSSVRYSNEKTMYQLTRLLIDQGHKEFGIIDGMVGSEPASLRVNGIKSALKEADIHLDEANIIHGNWTYDAGKQAAIQLFSKPDYPRTIMAMNDDMALGVYDAAKACGIRIPEDISVTGFDNANSVHHISPKMTTVERPLQYMGYRSMELLIDNLNGDYNEEANIILPCMIIEGESIKKEEDNDRE